MNRLRSVSVVVLLALAACSASSASSSSDARLVVNLGTEGPAFQGFAFPSTGSDGGFVDGWSLRFDRILVTLDDIVLESDPDANPTDQAQTGGEVRHAKGPWAIDLSKLKTEEGEPIATFDGLDPTTRYAFGFTIVRADAAAKRFAFDGDDEAEYQAMVTDGVSVLYEATATFAASVSACSSSDATYPWDTVPKSVKLRFAFETPTRSINCQNTSLRGRAFPGEEAQRGVQIGARGETAAHVVVHVDHPFWNTVDHDAAQLYFDQMAVYAKPDGTLTLADLAKADLTNFLDPHGRKLPWRSCVPEVPVRAGTRAFDHGSVPVDPSAMPERALRSYADFVAYLQSTQGHLEADGLCAVERQYPSPR